MTKPKHRLKFIIGRIPQRDFKVIDAETGEDLTDRMHIERMSFDLSPPYEFTRVNLTCYADIEIEPEVVSVQSPSRRLLPRLRSAYRSMLALVHRRPRAASPRAR